MRQRFGKVRGGGAWDFLEQLQARRCPKMGCYWLVSSPTAWNHGVSPKPQTISGAPITYGKILSRMDLVGSLRSPGRQVPTATISPLRRRTESVAWHQGQMSDGRGIGVWVAVNFLGDKPSHGSARIPPDPQRQQAKI